MERTLQREQCYNLPKRSMVETMVLVVLAHSPIGPSVAQTTSRESRVRSRNAGRIDASRILPGYNGRGPFGPAQPIQTVLPPRRKERVLRADRVQAHSHMVHSCSLCCPILFHSTHDPPAHRMVTVLVRGFVSIIHSHQRVSITGFARLGPLARDLWIAHGDGLSLVLRWGHEGTLGIWLRVLLCAFCLGCVRQGSVFASGLARTGGFLA